MNIYQAVIERAEAGTKFALGVVISSSGSTPQKAGAKALFEAGGAVIGTLGGGCLEAECRQRALTALDDGEPLLFDIKLDEVTGWDDGLICGGKVRVFIDPNVAGQSAAYAQANSAITNGQKGILSTWVAHPSLPPGTANWEGAEGVATWDGLRASAEESLNKGKPCIAAHDGGELFIEPVAPDPELIIAGAGHIGKAVAALAARSGFRVTIIDDRPIFANENNVPEAHRVICGDIAKEVAAIPGGVSTYFLIVTRGHRHDGAVLAECINKPAAYIGMIGSRRKAALIRKSIVEEGIASQEAVDTVVSPVGVDIGAETVDEIALSIAAELIAVKRGKAAHTPTLNYRK